MKNAKFKHKNDPARKTENRALSHVDFNNLEPFFQEYARQDGESDRIATPGKFEKRLPVTESAQRAHAKRAEFDPLFRHERQSLSVEDAQEKPEDLRRPASTPNYVHMAIIAMYGDSGMNLEPESEFAGNVDSLEAHMHFLSVDKVYTTGLDALKKWNRTHEQKWLLLAKDCLWVYQRKLFEAGLAPYSVLD